MILATPQIITCAVHRILLTAIKEVFVKVSDVSYLIVEGEDLDLVIFRDHRLMLAALGPEVVGGPEALVLEGDFFLAW